ncbi:hypothetical protein G6F49_005493 [Rhizopus delemar]|nr:hypothetical protein G6F49_005493 [Rhizopus delemar]KAG1586102.1 hypothetical protein G6F48_006818 [Rhizopus delemar]
MGSHNLTLWNQRLTYGKPTSYTFQGASIIDLFFSNVDLVSPSLTIRHDLSWFSNHKLMTLSFALPSSSRVQLPPQRTIWNLRKLKQQQTRGSYRDVFTEKLNIILPHHSSLNFPNRSVACQYIDTIHQQLSREEWLRDFWTPALTAAFQRKEHYYRKWRKAHGLNALRLWVLHQEAQATLRRLILKRRRETWRCFCDQMAQGNYTKAIVKFSRIRKNRAIKPSFSAPEGPQHAAEIMAQHLERIFDGDLLPHSADTILTNNDSTLAPYDVASCSITIDSVNNAIAQLPRRKAPGVDHLTIEMIVPLTDNLTPILVHLFQLCWRWSPVTDPGNFRPISLTSIFRKILEKCLYLDLVDQSPPLDITQGSFREARGTLDQALCLIEICSILRKHHHINPTLAFLDIKSAYDTVDRSYIWRTLQPYLDPALLNILKNLFNEVQIEVILGNVKSSRFSPKTGVLQGSILSSFLYSIYINQLPNLLRDHPLPHEAEKDPVDFALSVNCLLYGDDVVLIASSAQLPAILQKCEEHSYQLGCCLNLAKCTILALPEDTQSYTLYNTILPKQNSFPYLGIPICPGGYLHTQELIQGNVNKALKIMNEMAMIGVNPAGFDRLLSVRFYTQIVRPQLEYGLAISMCLRRIFGGGSRSLTQVMLHLVNQPSMKSRVHILQAKFILRSLNLPDDTLFSRLLPYLRTSASHSHWYKLTSSPLWRVCCNQDIEHLNRRTFRIICRKYLEDLFHQNCQRTRTKLLSACRSQSTIDPILWLSMTSIERSRVVRWRLG